MTIVKTISKMCMVAVMTVALGACDPAQSNADGGDANTSGSSASTQSFLGGERQCTQIGCVDGTMLNFGPAQTWPHGAYIFTVTADDMTATCTAALPYTGCTEVACDNPDVSVSASGCMLAPELHGFGGIRIARIASDVQVTIAVDDGQRAEWQATLQSQCHRPNGPQCEPECCSASADVPVIFER